MSTEDRTRERLRWHCRRGMLELDLVLKAFVERHLESLEPARLEAFGRLLELSDPELLELFTGRTQARDEAERELVALIREPSIHDRRSTQPA